MFLLEYDCHPSFAVQLFVQTAGPSKLVAKDDVPHTTYLWDKVSPKEIYFVIMVRKFFEQAVDISILIRGFSVCTLLTVLL